MVVVGCPQFVDRFRTTIPALLAGTRLACGALALAAHRLRFHVALNVDQPCRA
jgi:hypothetical protein